MRGVYGKFLIMKADIVNHIYALKQYGVHPNFIYAFDILPGRPKQLKLF